MDQSCVTRVKELRLPCTRMGAVIALDTSGTLISLAVQKSDGSIVHREVDGAGTASVSLIEAVTSIVEDAQVLPVEISTFIVGIGPGSFTGVRLAMSVAKGWSSANGCTIVGVESFEAMARGTSSKPGTIIVLGDARRGEFFYGVYSRTQKEDQFRVHQRAALVRVEDVSSVVGAASELCITAVFEAAVPEDLRSLPSGWTSLEASGIALGLVEAFKSGSQMFSGSTVKEVASIAPHYVREVSAKTIEERKETA